MRGRCSLRDVGRGTWWPPTGCGPPSARGSASVGRTRARRLPDAAATTTRGAGPLRQLVTRRVAGRVLLVGDAAGYVDALTGEGVSVALASARALVDCLVAERPEDYERQWRQASRRYRLLTATLLAAARRPLFRRAMGP